MAAEKDVDKDSSLYINIDDHENTSRIQAESHNSILEDFSSPSQSKKKYKNLTTENSEEDPLISSKQSSIFESLSTEKQIDSLFYSVQEQCINFQEIAHEDIISNLCQNIVTEPLVVINGRKPIKSKRIHSDMLMTKENMAEIDMKDLADCVKTSPRKRKTNISEYES